MPSKTYKGTAYKQSLDPDSPWILSFVAAAEDILELASIPRRAETGMIGFQRIEDPIRSAKAKEFFSMGSINQSPTAIVLGIHPQNSESTSIKVEFSDAAGLSDSIRDFSLTIDTSVTPETDQQVILRLKNQLALRLSESEAEIEEEEAEDEIADENEHAEGTEEFEIEAEDDEVEIGRSQLKKFLESLDDPLWTSANIADIREIAKPATIIDGQHRVLGAAACERGVPFTVCALYPCLWHEQVFQFTVVNYTAKRIPDQFITANAALSLTAYELGQLETRLIQAGVKVIEYELMRVVNFDARSPFYNLINLTEKADHSKIGYKTMVRVAKRWYDGNHQVVRKMIPILYPDITGKGKLRKQLELWKDGDWGEFFIEFWTEVNRKFGGKLDQEGRDLWSPGTNLLIAIVLYELQERFLLFLNPILAFIKPEPSEDRLAALLRHCKTAANQFLDTIPPDFFAIEWKTKSLSTSAGREALQAALRQLVESGGDFRYRNSILVKGQGKQ